MPEAHVVEAAPMDTKSDDQPDKDVYSPTVVDAIDICSPTVVDTDDEQERRGTTDEVTNDVADKVKGEVIDDVERKAGSAEETIFILTQYIFLATRNSHIRNFTSDSGSCGVSRRNFIDTKKFPNSGQILWTFL